VTAGDILGTVQAQVQFAAGVKALKAQNEMAKEVLRLLDPGVGSHLDRSA
jgi:hypothetical protein